MLTIKNLRMFAAVASLALMTLLSACSLWEKPLTADVEMMSPEQKFARDNPVTVGELARIQNEYPNVSPAEREILWVFNNGVSLKQLDELKEKSLEEFTPEDVDHYVSWLQEMEPSLTERVKHLALKGLGQPYDIYLLGEAPFEVWDTQPLFTFAQSDCVVFAEHVYAMSLAYDWRSFFAMLQRIRYKNGEIGNMTRNHFSLVDWDENNHWLVRDITPELAGDDAAPVSETSGRKKFFTNRVGIPANHLGGIEETTVNTNYVPADKIAGIQDKLQNGDLVHVIYSNMQHAGWCGHFGLVIRGDDGTVNMLHSTPPKVKIQPLMEYVDSRVAANVKRAEKNQAPFVGLKFLRLTENPIAELKKIDGPDAPIVTAPKGLYRDRMN